AAAPSRLPVAYGIGIITYLFILQCISKDLAQQWRPCARCLDWGIANEQAVYGPNTTLIRKQDFSVRTSPQYFFVNYGLKLRAEASPKPVIWMNIGMAGYYSGPGVVLIDPLALADPLMARLPVMR